MNRILLSLLLPAIYFAGALLVTVDSSPSPRSTPRYPLCSFNRPSVDADFRATLISNKTGRAKLTFLIRPLYDSSQFLVGVKEDEDTAKPVVLELEFLSDNRSEKEVTFWIYALPGDTSTLMYQIVEEELGISHRLARGVGSRWLIVKQDTAFLQLPAPPPEPEYPHYVIKDSVGNLVLDSAKYLEYRRATDSAKKAKRR